MTRKPTIPEQQATDRASLRRRVKRLYGWFNQEHWAKCFSLLDPRLREGRRVEQAGYVDSLRTFKQASGQVRLWYLRVNLHAGEARRADPRPFAYVYVVWQDDKHAFHMFRERWVKDSGHWYTRVVGLVPHKAPAPDAD
jgi:hypothetical protein